MVAGYVAGALNRGSENFKRLVISSVVATLVGSNFAYVAFALTYPYTTVTGSAFLSVFISTLIYVAVGIGIAALAKIILKQKKPTTYTP
jgi:hypothetical protein